MSKIEWTDRTWSPVKWVRSLRDQCIEHDTPFFLNNGEQEAIEKQIRWADMGAMA